LAAREYVTGLMKQAGLEVRIDPAGNIFGLRAGSEKLPILLFGSHIDSVLHGGNFDGDVGSMGAIEVMQALRDGSVKTRHPLEAVIWTNEEGNHFGIGTLGSGVAAGSRGTARQCGGQFGVKVQKDSLCGSHMFACASRYPRLLRVQSGRQGKSQQKMAPHRPMGWNDRG